MFALGIGGWLAVTAIPLLFSYVILALLLSVTVYLTNKISSGYHFNLTFIDLTCYTAVAWLISIILFFVFAFASYNLTQYPEVKILSFYPATQQVVSVYIFYLLCQSCLIQKNLPQATSDLKQKSFSAGIAAAPVVILLLCANLWPLIRELP